MRGLYLQSTTKNFGSKNSWNIPNDIATQTNRVTWQAKTDHSPLPIEITTMIDHPVRVYTKEETLAVYNMDGKCLVYE